MALSGASSHLSDKFAEKLGANARWSSEIRFTGRKGPTIRDIHNLAWGTRTKYRVFESFEKTGNGGMIMHFGTTEWCRGIINYSAVLGCPVLIEMFSALSKVS